MKIYSEMPTSQRAKEVWKFFELLHSDKELISLWFKKNRKKALHFAGWWFAEYDDGSVISKLPSEI